MIASLTGKITHKNPPELIFALGETGDISYEILAPMSSFYKFSDEKITIFTHLHIKEDAHTLFGFATLAEKQTFRELIKVNGVGPKVALAILSYLSVADLQVCIENEDDTTLAKTPGIGKKTAQKIIIEIKGKVENLGFATENLPENNSNKAKEALAALGFKDKECEKMLKDLDTSLSTEEIIRLALQNK
jgi:Holliday junction DNA helicase RuvA